MFITPAYAQAAESTLGLGSFVPLILIFVVFWFLLIRPAQKKAKNHQLMVSNLTKGDKVITGGGIYGKVTKVIDDTYIEVEISETDEESTRVKVVKATVSEKVGTIQSPSKVVDASFQNEKENSSDKTRSLFGGFFKK